MVWCVRTHVVVSGPAGVWGGGGKLHAIQHRDRTELPPLHCGKKLVPKHSAGISYTPPWKAACSSPASPTSAPAEISSCTTLWCPAQQCQAQLLLLKSCQSRMTRLGYQRCMQHSTQHTRRELKLAMLLMFTRFNVCAHLGAQPRPMHCCRPHRQYPHQRERTTVNAPLWYGLHAILRNLFKFRLHHFGVALSPYPKTDQRW